MRRSVSRRRPCAAAAPAEGGRSERPDGSGTRDSLRLRNRHGFGTSGALAKLVQRPVVERYGVELAVAVLAERGEGVDLAIHLRRREAGVAGAEAPDGAAAIVAVEVAALRGRHGGAAVDVPARDRAPV